MLPSEWLSSLKANSVYREARLYDLPDVGIKYDEGMLTSLLTKGTRQCPYSTYGRIASVNLLTAEEVLRRSTSIKEWMLDEDMAYFEGHEAAAAVWRLLHPVQASGPPSSWVNESLEEKMRRDLYSLRGYGY